jgi:aminoglycoside phosphotransferase family enzyme/predicted kinase
MRDRSFYSPLPIRVDVCETHASIVFLAGDLAYKVKKPVRLPFLDYSTLEARRHHCGEEARLNARFAPDVYLAVRAVAEHGDKLALAELDDPAAVEYVVVMRRLDLEATLERLVQKGAADERLAVQVGEAIAVMHEQSPHVPAGYWSPAYVAERMRENLDTAAPEVGTLIDPITFEAVQRFSEAFLRSNHALLERRAGEFVRDVHGDLRAEHILIERGRVTMIDCVEFDDRFRCTDVAADLAFLTMDLERLGAPALAAAVERAYVARTGDAQVRVLLPFYACYRAWVRAKVTALRLRQLADGDPATAATAARARELFALAQRFAWRARLPLVLVVCGAGASGKSTLAAALAARSGLLHISSDRIRKELAGVPIESRGGPGIYSDEHTARTYAELAGRAAAAVSERGGAIVDATFPSAARRQVLCERLEGSGARVLWIECIAPPRLLRERAAARERGPEHGSDATWPVIAAQLEARAPLDEVDPASRCSLRTDRPVADCLDEIDRFVSAAVGG